MSAGYDLERGLVELDYTDAAGGRRLWRVRPVEFWKGRADDRPGHFLRVADEGGEVHDFLTADVHNWAAAAPVVAAILEREGR